MQDPVEKPAQDAGMSPMQQEDIVIEPFKASRHARNMPFRKGQGISLAGWQFEIKNVMPNGNVLLITKGRIITEGEAQQVQKAGRPIRRMVKTGGIVDEHTS